MSERRAYVCPKCADDGLAARIFAWPRQGVPICPTHGRPMIRQPNRPYVAPVRPLDG